MKVVVLAYYYGILDSRVLPQHCLNLAQLDAKATNFNLVIDAT
jgi:hypothetical protein